MIQVRVDDLMEGRRLQFPIVDADGVLLLAENSEITPRFRELMQIRGIDSVGVHPDDAASATLGDLANELPGVQFDDSLRERLSNLDANASPRNSMVFHGCQAYDPVNRQRLSEKHEKSVKSIDLMVQQNLRGDRINGSAVAQMAAENLTEMTADCENVLTTASLAGTDNELAQHCLQMSLLGMAIGVEMELDADSVRMIGLCGMIHDWGMSKVPEEIRKVQRRLTRTEYIEVQKHCVYTQDMLESMDGLSRVVQQISYQVHERPNGRGYPRGRTREHIHPFARILNVADCYAAMTAARPYRSPVMPYHAMECLLRQSRDLFVDPDAVRALLRALSLFPIGSLVLLSDGCVAQVIRRNPESYTAPIVQRIQDQTGRRFSPEDADSVINLGDSKITVNRAVPNPRRNEIPLEGDELEFQSMR
ncbi:MAG: HD domain-containing protein [Planctomycetota bacterium]|nr:HD domain-containing protein [Planctomycetota bacterium]